MDRQGWTAQEAKGSAPNPSPNLTFIYDPRTHGTIPIIFNVDKFMQKITTKFVECLLLFFKVYYKIHHIFMTPHTTMPAGQSSKPCPLYQPLTSILPIFRVFDHNSIDCLSGLLD